jgi:hypothetical protein
VLKDIRPSALPVVAVSLAFGYASSVGAIKHCVQVHDAAACEVLVATLPDSTPENAPFNPTQGRPLVTMATTSSAIVGFDFKLVR